ncbi:unnamed protein product [Cylindrotheca closterium]|uniref:GAG-pre-integrase domain-containing protein n=1 Tax=Cylindrotheca closterium TaxID=2856 RepID=A0AAD2CJF0_9STRA|nr:unnamed protein product [Cylindrotheca closterium]
MSEQLLQGDLSPILPDLISSPSPVASFPSWDDDSVSTSCFSEIDAHDSDPPDPTPSVLINQHGTVSIYNATTTIATSIAEFAQDHLFLSKTSANMEPAFPVIWDSGASVCVTPHQRDFVGTLHSPPNSSTKGIGGPIEVTGCGHVAWTFKTTTNTFRTLILPAILVPLANQRLLGTSSLLHCHSKETISLSSDSMLLSGTTSDGASTRPIAVDISPTNNLPTGTAYRVIDSPQPTPEAHADDVTVAINNLHSSQGPAPTSSRTDRNSFMMSSIAKVRCHNINLDDGDKEWLKWHHRLGHHSFAIVRFLMRTGTLAKSQRMRTLHTHISKQVEPPKCAACCYAKAKLMLASRMLPALFAPTLFIPVKRYPSIILFHLFLAEPTLATGKFTSLRCSADLLSSSTMRQDISSFNIRNP